MGSCRVPDCNGATDYDDNAQAVLCTTCGTVATQDILTHEWDGELSGSSLYFGPTTLKSLRRVGGALTGQSSKEDRDRRNTVAIHQYINVLLTKLACSGLAPRAQSLFDRARVCGKYRWGKKAVLVAGACMTVVLRESKKGVMMSHLAHLMDVSPHALCRIFTQINTLLTLNVPAFDPLSLLLTLQSHLNSLISSPTCPLSPTIVKMLQSLPPAPVLRLATSLATLINRLEESSSSGASVPATACALLLLALEGQAASSLPSYVSLAQELGKKVGVRKDLVLGRYRDICKIVEEWMEDVPWISGADHPDNKLGKRRRKTSQRDLIAMGLKDVVQFQEDIAKARKEREAESPITVSLEVSEEDEDWERSTECSQSTDGSIVTGRKRKRAETSDTSISSSKFLRLTRSRRARPLTSLDMASLSLLSPSHPLAPEIHVKKQPERILEVDGLQTQILTSPAFPTGVSPSRLQRLAMARGGECNIGDEELFEDGELDGFIRTDGEVDKLRDFFGWNGPEQLVNPPTQPSGSSSEGFDWDLVDMATWADFGSDKETDQSEAFDVGEQVLGEWREPSPPAGRDVDVGDRFDIHGEW